MNDGDVVLPELSQESSLPKYLLHFPITYLAVRTNDGKVVKSECEFQKTSFLKLSILGLTEYYLWKIRLFLGKELYNGDINDQDYLTRW